MVSSCVTKPPLVEILPFHQLQKQWLVNARTSREVEFVERLGGRKASRLQPTLRCLAFPFDQLQLTELEQERQVIRVIGSAPLRDLLAFGVHDGKLQGLQVMLEQHGALAVGLAHGVTSPSNTW